MRGEPVKRLESLDVLHGFDMFFIFLPDPVPCIVLTFLAMFGLEHSAFAAQFDHCAWNGLHFYDCIFPLFLFISGVTFPFSYARQRERGDSTARISLKILRRTVVLFLMGAMLWTTIDGVVEKNILSFEWSTFRVWSVIGRIGIAWGAAAFLFMAFGRKARIGIAAAILVGMWMLLRFAVAPGAPEGVNPLVNRQWMWANWVDVNFLTTAHRGEGGVVTITMVATAMFGNFAGEILLGEGDRCRCTKVVRLLLFAALLAVAGLLMAFAKELGDTLAGDFQKHGIRGMFKILHQIRVSLGRLGVKSPGNACTLTDCSDRLSPVSICELTEFSLGFSPVEFLKKLICKIIDKKEGFTLKEFPYADANNDGVVDTADLVDLKKFLAGLIEELGV